MWKCEEKEKEWPWKRESNVKMRREERVALMSHLYNNNNDDNWNKIKVKYIECKRKI